MLRRSPKGNTPRREAKQYSGANPSAPRAPASRVAYGKARLVVPLPKDAPTRDEAYRRLVAALPCSNCGVHGFSQAAHGPTLGAGIKASDLDTFPLCCTRPGEPGCHFKFDQYQLFDAAARALMAAVWARRAREQIEGQPA